MTDISEFIDPQATPSGDGCVECDESGSWWVHLRRCARCGHIGCCDSSLNKHATAHYRATGHRIMQSFEPGEDWAWDYAADYYVKLDAPLAAPDSHPASQPTPGPAGRVPADWESLLS